jgi:NodT family efflux transporter outer membrane factor (OMF) lipoprotein
MPSCPIRSLCVAIAIVAPLSACAVGPDFKPPKPPAVSRITSNPQPDQTARADAPGGASQRFVEGLDIPGEWWTLYHSPALNALIKRTLDANPDLSAAQAALRQARESYYAQRGALWPTIDANYTPSEQKTSATEAPLLADNAEMFSLHTAQVTVGYTPDVFGGVRRQVEASKAQAEQQRFQTEATYLTLTSNVVTAAIQVAQLGGEIAATQRIIAADQGVLDQMRRQFASGQIGRADVAAQKTVLAQAVQTLPPLERQLAQQRDLLADLTGRFPSESGEPAIALADLTLPNELPVSLPSKLVEQRPDVKAAEANLHAASALVGVAIANRLPGFTLSANAGGIATNFAQMFSSGNGFWTLSGEIAQPIFEGGALRHRQRAAEAALAQAKDQYRSTVLSAFQNVADTLQALEADARLLQGAAAADRSATESLAIARQQFELGEVGAIPVLNAQQAYQQAELALVQAEANRYLDTAALFQALGGGWWNRSDVRPAPG